MNLAKNRNQNGVLITLTQACQDSNLGATAVREIARKSGAARKIGRSYRINKDIFFDYIEKEYAE